MQDFVYPVGNIETSTFLWHKPQNLVMDNTYCQLLYAQQSTSSILTGDVYFDQKYTADYNISVSSLYYSIAYILGNVVENSYNLVHLQSNPGIWKTPSLTSSNSEVADRVQQIKISRYYYQDEITNGTFRFYYYPSISTNYPSITGLQTQNVLRFININEDYFGPSFAVIGNQVSNNFSGCASAITVDVIWRPIPQQNYGYIWHRNTTDGNNILNTYSDTASGSVSSYSFYSNEPAYGIGVYFNHLSPIYDIDKPKPYFDFYVYGQLPGATGHYLNLSNGLINQNASSRFYLEQSTLNILFDGNFHSLRFIWNIIGIKYSNTKIYLDGIELNSYSNGTGRTEPLNFTLNNSSSITSTPFYFFSKADNGNNLSIQNPSLFSAYGETKHILIFDKTFENNFIDASSTSNDQINLALGSTTSNLCAWFAFNSSASGFSSIDIAKNYTNYVTSSLTGTIVNDTGNNSINVEGSINRIYGLLHDRVGNYLNSTFDKTPQNYLEQQRIVGKLYSNEYGVSSSAYIGAIFYDKGNVLILNDHYNTDINQSTQLFTSGTGTFGIQNSNTVWESQYLSFLGTKYIERNKISVTAFAEHFAKSTNQSSYFEGSNGNAYTKNNAKAFTGIIWFGNNGRPIAATKFSKPIYKPENNDVIFNINIDI